MIWPFNGRHKASPFERDRALGALLGLAVGDALGTTLEFSRRDAGRKHTEMTGGGPFHLQPGQWTDDTAMALCLGYSLTNGPGPDPRDLMSRFANWRDHGYMSCTGTCFDVGNVTSAAISSFLATGDPIAGSPSPDSAGNGSIMRLAPAVIANLGCQFKARRAAVLQGATTHGARECAEACDLMAAVLHGLITRPGSAEPVLALQEWQGETHSVRMLASGIWHALERDQVRSTGYVIDTLEAALWCTHHSDSFEQALVLAVNLAGDADTVGAVTGQIAGAVHGMSRIPPRWLAPLAMRGEIEHLGHRLIDCD